MVKRSLRLVILLLCFCMVPIQAQAVSTADAKEPISPQADCSLTVSYGYDGAAFAGYDVQLYKIAEVSADYQYTLTEAFAGTGLALNGIQSHSEWNVIRSTLEAYILAESIAPTQIEQTDASGQAAFQNLKPGLYLASSLYVIEDDATCFFTSALVALPGLGADGLWQYQVAAAAKPETLPPIEPDEEITLRVLKLWKGDEGQNVRPRAIEVELFRDGSLYETVLLSEENHWSYSWAIQNDGATWKAVERNVPDGYIMTVAEKENTFVLTNTWDDPGNPNEPPKTGDTGNILLHTVLMYVSGTLLIFLGIAGRRKRHDETH